MTDTLLIGLIYLVGGLVAAASTYILIKMASNIWDAIWATPEIRDELVKIRKLLEK